MPTSRESTEVDESDSTDVHDGGWSNVAFFRTNLVAAVVSTIGGIAIIVAANGYAFAVGNLPGPGMYPMILGIAMTVLGVFWVIGTLLGRYPVDPQGEARPTLAAIGRSALAILAIVGFVFALRPVGYLISSAVLVSLLILVGRGSWRQSLLSGPLFAIASYLVVTTGLGVPLSLGVLEPLLGFMR